MSGVQKLYLNNLNINIRNALIIGIIIAKSSPRNFNSKKKTGESRGVMSFTLRDSQIDTINIDIWGSEYFILTFYERFLVGDIGLYQFFKLWLQHLFYFLFSFLFYFFIYYSGNFISQDLCQDWR